MHKLTGSVFLRFIPLLAGILIGMAALGIGLFFGERNRKKDELLRYLHEHPEAMAIAAYTFDARGEPVEGGYAQFQNADTPFVMASTMKTVVLAAYAEAVVLGDIDPGERIPVHEVEAFYVPFTDGGAHQNGLASLGLRADAAGFASDPAATLCIDEIARIMIHYSGNAEADYLITRLGTDRITSLMDRSGMEHHSPIRPILGAVLTIFNQENSLVPTRSPEELVRLYLQDPAWRAAQIAFIGSGKAQTTLEIQAAWMDQMGARGTAREYARLMARIASGSFLSPEVSQRMQKMLESVPTDWPLRLLFYRRLGAKEGVTPGVLALASYMVPKNGGNARKSLVTVLLLNHLPSEVWSTAVQYDSHFLVQADLAHDAGELVNFAGVQ